MKKLYLILVGMFLISLVVAGSYAVINVKLKEEHKDKLKDMRIETPTISEIYQKGDFCWFWITDSWTEKADFFNEERNLTEKKDVKHSTLKARVVIDCEDIYDYKLKQELIEQKLTQLAITQLNREAENITKIGSPADIVLE